MKYKTYWNALDGSEVQACESPLEEGVFHIPAHSVETKPPTFDPFRRFKKLWVCLTEPFGVGLMSLKNSGMRYDDALQRTNNPLS